MRKPARNMSMSPSRQLTVLSPFWLLVWAGALSLAWLIPNHFLPWPSFHMDTWAATVAVTGALGLLARDRSPANWYGSACMVACLIAVPWVQFAAGMIPFAGQAWMSSAYLFGLLCAILVGAKWERATPEQLPRALFLAIVLASVVSVWLQLSTWLDVWEGGGYLDTWWSMTLSGDRPYANLGQPNLLATLLIWGLWGCLWFYLEGRLGACATIVLLAYLLVGVALTQSRMAWLVLTVGLAALWAWRHLWPSRRLPWVGLGLYLFFLVCPYLMSWLQEALGSERDLSRLHQIYDVRLAAWRVFAAAVWERPWFGYGWTELLHAQMAVTGRVPAMHAAFAHTHNLFLDFLAWNGIPIGVLIIASILAWLWLRLRAVKSARDAVLFMMIGGIGIHAMLELPLQYVHFLLPVGMVIGVLDVRSGARAIFKTSWWVMASLCLAAALLLGLLVRDYLRIEESYTVLRFEERRIGKVQNPPPGPPDVVLLTQLREWIRSGRYKAHAGMSPQDLAWMRDLTSAFPTTPALFRLGTALALNGQPEEARVWLGKICPVLEEDACVPIQKLWRERAQGDKRLEAVKWPAP